MRRRRTLGTRFEVAAPAAQPEESRDPGGGLARPVEDLAIAEPDRLLAHHRCVEVSLEVTIAGARRAVEQAAVELHDLSPAGSGAAVDHVPEHRTPGRSRRRDLA